MYHYSNLVVVLLMIILGGEVVGQEPNIPVRKASVEENVGMSVNVMVMTQLTVKLHLSSNHR
jgi:hypothetical protein